MFSTNSLSGPETRSVTEVVIRTITTYVFALRNYGHLCSLPNVPKRFHVLYVIMFFSQPGIIVGELVYGLFKAVGYWRKHIAAPGPGPDLGFYLQGMIGVHAKPHETLVLEYSPIPLFTADHKRLQRSTYDISWKWFGKVLICLFAVIQAIGTVVLSVRR
jgi:hypothetical protein